MIKGKALTVDLKQVESICGYNGKAGYKEGDVGHEATAKLSFMPKTTKVHKIKELVVGGRNAVVLKTVASEYISGMFTFFIKYED
ncbi:MAG: hypothetical protein JKY62_16825 [Desulfocapsa sp.]|nr:hypothetical protein [Desulfocapsa sp.]